jgi:Mn2+/Fe2+ NRAMP family transporter
MLFSNLVMYFIILATAATLHQSGQTDIESAAQAAEAPRPLAGDAATFLMALGLIGTGSLPCRFCQVLRPTPYARLSVGNQALMPS